VCNPGIFSLQCVFKDFLFSYPFLYQFTASGAEGSREGRTDTVLLETGKAKFEEFLHGKVITFQLSFGYLASLMFLRTRFQ
jgi:hypothetical protein